MTSTDAIDLLKSVLATAEFGRWASNLASGFRHACESDREALERAMKQARKTICGHCYGTRIDLMSFTNFTCHHCLGTGERAYDPHLKPVAEVLES